MVNFIFGGFQIDLFSILVISFKCCCVNENLYNNKKHYSTKKNQRPIRKKSIEWIIENALDAYCFQISFVYFFFHFSFQSIHSFIDGAVIVISTSHLNNLEMIVLLAIHCP